MLDKFFVLAFRSAWVFTLYLFAWISLILPMKAIAIIAFSNHMK